MFYAPWCGHCKNAKPEVGKALGGIATEYSDYQKGQYQKKGKTAIVMVNGDDHPELTQQFGVQGYPTFKLLKGVSDKNTLSCQSTHDYSGGRSSGDFERFLGGDSLEGFANRFNNGEEFNDYEGYANRGEDAFVMFYAPWCGHCEKAKPNLEASLGGIAVDYDKYSSGGRVGKYKNKAIVLVDGTKNKNLLSKFGVKGYPTYVMINGVKDKKTLEGEKFKEYKGGRTTVEINRFLR